MSSRDEQTRAAADEAIRDFTGRPARRDREADLALAVILGSIFAISRRRTAFAGTLALSVVLSRAAHRRAQRIEQTIERLFAERQSALAQIASLRRRVERLDGR